MFGAASGLHQGNRSMKKFVRAAALAAVLLASIPAHALPPASAGGPFDATTLSLSAYGEAKVVPDQATITLGVQTTAATAAGAMGDNAAQMTRVMDALHRAGVADKDIQTS